MPGIYSDIFDDNNNVRNGIDFVALLKKWHNKNYYEFLGVDGNFQNQELSEDSKKYICIYIALFQKNIALMRQNAVISSKTNDEDNSHNQADAINKLAAEINSASNTLYATELKLSYDANPNLTYFVIPEQKPKQTSLNHSAVNNEANRTTATVPVPTPKTLPRLRPDPFDAIDAVATPLPTSNTLPRFLPDPFASLNIRSSDIDISIIRKNIGSAANIQPPQLSPPKQPMQGLIPPYGSQFNNAAAYNFSASVNNSSLPRNAQTDDYRVWSQFLNQTMKEDERRKFIEEKKPSIHKLFRKEIIPFSIDGVFNPLRIAIEGGSLITIKYLLLAGARFSLTEYSLATADHNELINKFKRLIPGLDSLCKPEEFIALLASDQGVFECCPEEEIRRALQCDDEKVKSNQQKIIHKLTETQLKNIVTTFIKSCKTSALSLIVETVLHLKTRLFSNELSQKALLFFTYPDLTPQVIYELLCFLRSQGIVFDLASWSGNSLIKQAFDYASFSMMITLLNCGVLLDENHLELVRSDSPINPIQRPKINYLRNLPPEFIDFQLLISKILKLLKQLPLSSSNVNVILEDLQQFFVHRKLNITTVRREDLNCFMPTLFTYLRYITHNYLKDNRIDIACKGINIYNQARLLAIAFGFEIGIQPQAIPFEIARFYLINRIESQQFQNGDYLICSTGQSQTKVVVYILNNTYAWLELNANSVSHICRIPFSNLLTPTMAELFRIRAGLNQTILHLVARGHTDYTTSNQRLLNLINDNPELVTSIVNEQDINDDTALHIAAWKNPHNAECCKRLVQLGARVDISVKGISVSQYTTVPFIPELIELARKYDKEHGRKNVADQILQKRTALLATFKEEYKQKALQNNAFSQLNLDILEGRDFADSVLKYATSATLICAILVGNIDLVQRLMNASPYYLTADALPITLLTDNQTIIKLIFDKFPVYQYPDNIMEILEICTPEAKKLVPISSDKSLQMEFAQIKQDQKVSAEALRNGWKNTIQPNEPNTEAPVDMETDKSNKRGLSA